MNEEGFDVVFSALKEMTKYTIDQDEQGGCVYCGMTAVGSRIESDTTDESHTENCHWIIGRKVVLSIQPDAFDNM